MINRNFKNQSDMQIRQNGHPWSLVADVDNEIYQNLDNLDSQFTNQVSIVNQQQNNLNTINSQVNDIINSQLPQKQNILNDHQNRIQNNENSINVINADSQNKQNQIDNLVSKFKIFEGNALDNLALFFENHGDELGKTKNKWLWATIIVVAIIVIFDIILFATIGLTEKLSLQNSWYLTLPVNIFAISIFYFVVAQYSSYKRLELEYKNRAVVAKSYFGILNQAQSGEEKNIITKTITDTLFSRNVTDQGAELPLKELAKIADKIIGK